MLWPAMLRAFSLAVLVLVLPGVASAQEDARALFTQGQAAYETGDYATAARLWERAYEIDSRPLLQYNLAQAYERLGQLEQAIEAYQIYVDGAETVDQRVQGARARIASLRQRVSQTRLSLSGGPEGAQVVIDGTDRGRLPHPDPFQVEPGNHRIVVRADGFEDFVSTVAVSAGQSADVTVEMRPGVSGGASDTEGGGIWLPGLIIAAGGAAIGITGGVLGGLALAAAGDAPSNDGPEADEARTFALVADILIPTGVVAVAAGLVLMFVIQDGGGDSASNGDVQLVPVLAQDQAGAALIGSF